MSLPLSPNPLASAPIPLPRRRRGGQPCNRNALKHGFYAVRNQVPLNHILSSLPILQENSHSVPRSSQQVIDGLHAKNRILTDLALNLDPSSVVIPLAKEVIKGAREISNIVWASYVAGLGMRDLGLVADFALVILRHNFHDCGIDRDADSFRVVPEKSDLKSRPFWKSHMPDLSLSPWPFIPDDQWAVIERFIPPDENQGCRGRPAPDPRELLGAIFWKLAHHARWQELPLGSPPMLTCRRYYRRLFLSGRLETLCKVLYNDLVVRGRVDLALLVAGGCFSLAGNRVILHAGLQDAWQLRTALFFLQQGYQVLRRLRREYGRRMNRLCPRRRFHSFAYTRPEIVLDESLAPSEKPPLEEPASLYNLRLGLYGPLFQPE